MRFMVIVKGDEGSESGQLPPADLFDQMSRFNEEMANAGVLISAEGLHPTSKGARIRFSGTSRSVIDGPFTESKEIVAGYWLIQTGSLAEAVEWMKRAPFGGGELEIRPIHEMEDLAGVVPPDVLERERRMRAQVTNEG